MYNLRSGNSIKTTKLRKNRYGKGIEKLAFNGHKLWESVQIIVTDFLTLECSRKKKRKWKPVNFSCKICKIYLAGIAYLAEL